MARDILDLAQIPLNKCLHVYYIQGIAIDTNNPTRHKTSKHLAEEWRPVISIQMLWEAW